MGMAEYKFRLSDHTNICTAELYAIKQAFLIANRASFNNILICTDSLTSIKILKQLYSTHPFAIEIKSELQNSQKHFTIMWIPSHCDIGENHRVDTLAKEALTMEKDQNFLFHHKDFKTLIYNKIKDKWAQEWHDSPSSNKLREIKPYLLNNDSINYLSRRDSTIISRLRIGHTRLTHKYIIEKTNPPNCICNLSTLSVKHIFNECTSYSNLRNQYGILNSTILNSNICDDLEKIILFFKSINLFYHL